jgi:hypothetical protein
MSNITLPYNWAPRDYQMPVCQALDSGIKRLITIWHRRAGKDLTAINMCAKAAHERVGLYLHLLPFYKQGRKIVWNGMDKTGKPFLSAFPDELIESKNDQEMILKLKNGSIYQVAGTDNIDSLVGINPVGIILSEFSIQDPHAWDLLRPILAENEGWAWFVYTPRGKNHGYTLFEKAKKNPNWFTQLLTVEDTKAIPLSAIQEDRDMGMPEEIVLQEYYCSFEAPLVGAYYSKQLADAQKEGRIGNVPWSPSLPVHTFWDIGMGDSTAIWFAQFYGFEIRVIDYYENSGEGLAHYVKLLKEKPYVYGEHWGPHDINVREFTTGTSRLETARQLGLNFRVAPKTGIEDGIEAVRNILPRCYFDANRGDMEMGIEALKQYQKEYDDKRQVFKNKPLHDWTSHAADAFRMMATVAKRLVSDKKKKHPSRAISDYDII